MLRKVKFVQVREYQQNSVRMYYIYYQMDKGDIIMDSGTFSQVAALAHFVFDNEYEFEKFIEKVHDVYQLLDSNDQKIWSVTCWILKNLSLK